jgi:hypothetical protein
VAVVELPPVTVRVAVPPPVFEEIGVTVTVEQVLVSVAMVVGAIEYVKQPA